MSVHVVSHTHWDREWYHPAERFRQRLVPLIDELLDEPQAEATSFLLDGQTVILEDYLEVRPERASEIATALRERKLEAGPWFVLADELIPSGEALVRNLLAGRRTLRALRAESPPVLYCPDSFGHPATLPALARGFDKPLIILWRGFGGPRAPRGDTFSWSAPSGDRALLYHLTQSGYELGANLPLSRDEASARWERIRREIATRSTTGLALLLNGADHHARQQKLPLALRVLREIAAPDDIRSSSLADFAADLERRATKKKLRDVRGELRDSYGYAWTLAGTLASRAPQKRRYALVERALLRDVEPWVALAAFRGSSSRRHLTNAAWRSLLLCQPHDTLCGCSIDQVARAMEARLESAAAQAEGLHEDAVFDLIGHDRDAARLQPDKWQPMLLVRNRAARARSGVALVEITMKAADVLVGPGSKPVNAASAEWAIPGPGQVFDVVEAQERTEAPRTYPDNDAVVRFRAAIWADDIPAYGLAALPHSSAAASGVERPVVVKGRSLSNDRLTMRWDASGHITIEDTAEHRRLRGLIEWESRVDAGDLYTPSIRGKKFVPRLRGTRVLHRGPLRGVVEQRWQFASKGERVELSVHWILDADSKLLRLRITGDNAARDHRLRLRIRTDVREGRTVADAAFGAVERKPLKVSARDAEMEKPVASAPLHRYVSLFNAQRGATLYSDGLTEYETANESIFVTLLRCVGELSRNDLPERPGHAGWPEPTPEAQCLGQFEAELSLMLHGPRDAAVIDEIERAADDALFPLTGETLRSALRVPAPIHGVALDGRGLSFQCAKESDSGEWLVLRCVNLLDRQTKGSWQLGRAIREARLARLDETPLESLQVNRSSIPFLAAPRAITTILVR